MPRCHPLLLVALASAVATLALPGLLAGADLPPILGERAAPAVVAELEAEGRAEALVVLAEQADLSGASAIEGRVERIAWVVERLVETANRTQGPLLGDLASRGVPFRAFWVTNMVWVEGDVADLAAVAARPEVARLDANPRVPLDAPVPPDGPAPATRGSGIEPNVVHVGAPELWDLGITGEGIVVAGQDTGYDWEHPALKNAYRGWDGDSVTHDYTWHDAIHSGGGSCGADSPEPCDDHFRGHGTHTMGTMVGDDGGSNRIGVAPGARWIGCRNMDQGDGTPTTYTECFEFFLAPTDSAGENADPAMAPHVINNSWACPQSEGCSWDTLQAVVENVRAAGIVVVSSAGNSGFDGCSTVEDPPAIYDAAFSVGATGASDDTITSFSSRGPVTVDGSDRLKPDVVAPGSSIRSSVPGGGYDSLDGTSMAGPHVAGLVALVLSDAPGLVGDPDGIEAHLRDTAVPRTTTQDCGTVAGSEVPNNTYGFGAVRAVRSGLLFAHGFEGGTTAGWTVGP